MRSGLVLLAVAACSSSSSPAEPTTRPVQATPKEPAAMTEPPCLATWTIERDDSVLSEQRRVGPHADDYQVAYEAEYLDGHDKVETTSRFEIGGTALLWFNKARTAAIVNAAVLSRLTVARATHMGPGDTVRIGTVTELGMEQLGHNGVSKRELIEFLIRADVIHTYLHIGATLCLVREDDGPDGYRAEFGGVHTYFTNEKNTDRLAFSVELRPDGAIVVNGEARSQQP